jgi:hypothetical protein
MNKKRGTSNAERVEGFFKDHPDRTHLLGNIASSTGLTRDQVRGAISYLAAKAKAGNAIGITVVQRGKQWRYTAPVEKPVGTKDFNRMTDALGHDDKPITEQERRAKATVRAFGEDLAKMHPVRRLELRIVGETLEGYVIGVNDSTGGAFKVVPL